MKTNSTLCKIPAALFLAAILLFSSRGIHAAVYTWNTGDGSYQTAGNWTPGGGPPTTGDTINLFRAAPVIVSSTGAVTISDIDMASNTSVAANFTLDLGGGSMSLSAATGLAMRSTTTTGNKTLAITNGTLSTPTFNLQNNATNFATSIFRIGSGATLNTTAASASYIGNAGAAQMYVESGGIWNANTNASSIVLRSRDTGTSLLQITGSGSQVNASAVGGTGASANRVQFNMGNDGGTSNLEVLNGGSFIVDDLNIGTRFSSGVSTETNNVSVSGATTTFTAGRVYVGGGTSASPFSTAGGGGNKGTFTVNSGATATAGLVDIFSAGTVTMNGGTLNVGSDMVLIETGGLLTGNGTIGGSVQFNTAGGTITGSGGTLSITGALNTPLNGTIGGGTVNVAGTTTVSASRTLTVNGTLGGAGSMVTSGNLAGTGTINKAITLSNGNTITSSGTLTLGSTLTIGNFAPTISSGTLSVAGTTTINNQKTFTINGTLAGAGDLVLSGDLNVGNPNINGSGAINKSGGTISGTGTIGGTVITTLANGAISGGIFTNAVTANNSAISGGTYNSSLTLGNGSTWTGSRTLANALVISGTGATVSSGTLTANGTTTVNNGATLAVNGTLDGSGSLGFQSTAAAGLSGTGTISKAVTLNGNKTLSSSGTLTLGSTLGVSGTGNAISSGTVSAGATTINSGGALAVNGTLSGANGLAVNGILSGSGIINKAVTVSSTGTLSPGNSPGNLSMSSLTLAAGGNYNWQVYNATGSAGTAFDTITVSGILDLTGLSTSTKYAINLWSLSGIAPDASGNAINFNSSLTQSWTLIGAGSLSGPVGNINDYFSIFTTANNGTDGFTNTFTGAFSIGTSGNNLVLNYTAAIPEPSTYVLLGLGVAVLLFVRKRRSGVSL